MKYIKNKISKYNTENDMFYINSFYTTGCQFFEVEIDIKEKEKKSGCLVM
jgi:hypothetical protein